jgi:hypothetical protein
MEALPPNRQEIPSIVLSCLTRSSQRIKSFSGHEERKIIAGSFQEDFFIAAGKKGGWFRAPFFRTDFISAILSWR